MTELDKIKRSALGKMDSCIKNKFISGWLLENIKLSKMCCNLSDEEYAEVKTNISSFNESIEGKMKYCKNRSITIPKIEE